MNNNNNTNNNRLIKRRPSNMGAGVYDSSAFICIPRTRPHLRLMMKEAEEVDQALPEVWHASHFLCDLINSSGSSARSQLVFPFITGSKLGHEEEEVESDYRAPPPLPPSTHPPRLPSLSPPPPPLPTTIISSPL